MGMTVPNPFETMAAEYDAWFTAHPALFESELRAIEAVLPSRRGRWVEIGVGTGQFASRLGIRIGVEPAAAMAERARARGVRVLQGTAECLPLRDASIDAAFHITTLCFVSDVGLALSEVHRVLKPGGVLIVAILPRDSEIGRRILADQASPFFRKAGLLTTPELQAAMTRAGFRIERTVVTLTDLSAPERFEEPRNGPSQGSFAVVRGVRAGAGTGSMQS
jgi:ubiquinone/menaquinone biosynthesis C-methylase UbiE